MDGVMFGLIIVLAVAGPTLLALALYLVAQSGPPAVLAARPRGIK
jgi:hypothetical protein